MTGTGPPPHDVRMPHDIRYPDDERGCPPNCPHRLWIERRREP